MQILLVLLVTSSHSTSTTTLLLAASVFPTLQIRKTTSLGVDIAHLLIALSIEGCQLLTCGCAKGFFKIGAQPAPAGVGLVCNAVAGVDAFCFIRGMIFGVKG